MKITNTQLAAALIVLGYEILPSTDYSSKEVIFEFADAVRNYQDAWRELSSGTVGPGNEPLSWMQKASKARQWVLDQVIHGDHNSGITLPELTMQTGDLDFVICLVAGGHYLLKLDKEARIFHFSHETEREWSLYNESAHNGAYDYQRRYLKSLSRLVKQIGSRNLARQQKRPAITCAQS